MRLPPFALVLVLAGCAARPAAPPAGHGGYQAGIVAAERLRTCATVAGQPLAFPSPAEVTALEVAIPAGAETGWHRHPAPGFAYVLEGELAVETADGTVRTFRAGEAFAEVVDLAHNGRAAGGGPVRLVAWFSAAPGAPVTLREPAAPRP